MGDTSLDNAAYGVSGHAGEYGLVGYRTHTQFALLLRSVKLGLHNQSSIGDAIGEDFSRRLTPSVLSLY